MKGSKEKEGGVVDQEKHRTRFFLLTPAGKGKEGERRSSLQGNIGEKKKKKKN